MNAADTTAQLLSSLPFDWSKLQWYPNGGADCGNRDRLLASVRLGGAHFHVEAIRIDTEADGVQASTCPYGSEILVNLFDISGCAGFETVAIDGHDYVIVLYPFER